MRSFCPGVYMKFINYNSEKKYCDKIETKKMKLLLTFIFSYILKFNNMITIWTIFQAQNIHILAAPVFDGGRA